MDDEDALMAYLAGVVLALLAGVFGTVVGLDRQRSFYATVMIVIACLYGLFAAMGGSTRALVVEGPGIFLFSLAAVVGFKRSMWVVAGALLAHGIFDFIHPHVIENPGVPAWWPMFCMSYDVTAAVYLGVLLSRRRGETL